MGFRGKLNYYSHGDGSMGFLTEDNCRKISKTNRRAVKMPQPPNELKTTPRSGVVRNETKYYNWIAREFHDVGFHVAKNDGKGDCLFQAVSQAFGGSPTAQEIRDLVSQLADDEEYQVKQAMFNDARNKLIRKMKNPGQVKLSNYDIAELQRDLRVYSWLTNVQNVDQFKEHLAQSGVWGDGESMGHMEQLFGVKFIVLSEQQFKKKFGMAYHNTFIPEGFAPQQFIILTYRDGAHYDLVTYNKLRIFNADELPKSIVREFDEHCPQYKRDIVTWPTHPKPAAPEPVTDTEVQPASFDEFEGQSLVYKSTLP